MQKRITYGLVIIATLIAAELVLQLTQSKELLYDWWFTGNFHQPDEWHGYVTTPNYRGAMRHQDKVFYVPVDLDKWGNRKSLETDQPGEPRNIVYIGGASMIFSYGVTDEWAIPNLVTQYSKHPIKSTIMAWPGVSSYRSFLRYRELMEQGLKPDLVVFGIPDNEAKFIRFADEFDQLPVPPSHNELFRFNKGFVVRSPGPVADWAGKWYFRSIIIKRALEAINVAVVRGQRWFGDRKVAVDKESRYKQWLQYVHRYFTEKDIPVLFFCIPRIDAPEDLYEWMYEDSKDEFLWLDTHRPLIKTVSQHTLANNHLDEKGTSLVARRLTQKLDEMLESRN